MNPSTWFTDPKEKYAWLLYSAVLAGVFGFLAHWSLFEYDLFWQVRAGLEILDGAPVQTRDSWSFTASGPPWYNYQWLSMVFEAALYRIFGGYDILILLR